MITGFNTDVKHKSKVYHVQTEDKGRANPKIETLVYMGGEILDSYRTTYDSDRDSLGEDEIVKLMEAQHKRVIKRIKIGKYDEEEDFPSDVVSRRSLDEVIREYLEEEQGVDPLVMNVEFGEVLRDGGACRVNVLTRNANSGEPIANAWVKVRLISTVEPPRLLMEGETDRQGHFDGDINLPPLQKGKYAIVVQSISDQGTAEFRRDVS